MNSRTRQERSGRETSGHTNADALRRAVQWIVNDQMFDDLKIHGNTKWRARDLVVLAIFWVWSDNRSLVDAFSDARHSVMKMFGRAAVSSYAGLTGALTTWTNELRPRLSSRLHELMQQCGGKSWRVGIWLVLAVDGTRVGVPRTKDNERRFCAAKKKSRKKKKRGRKKKNDKPQPVSPQMWLTLIWHVGLRLPWCWETGPSNSSERAHFQQMLAGQYPQNTLFCGDAGFVGYEFWKTIEDRNHHFLVRVGSNVSLLKKLGFARERNGIVYCWPEAALKKKQPPLVLRLLHFKDCRGDVYLVTNVLCERKLSTRRAAEIYRRRWGIEVQFRSFKQTFQRSKLRSRTPDHAEIELHWSLLGLWMIQLLAVKEHARAGDPSQAMSVAAVLRILRSVMYNLSHAPPTTATLQRQLQNATIDHYKRKTKKKSRNYPRRKEEPSAGKPQIRLATREHKRKLKELKQLAVAC